VGLAVDPAGNVYVSDSGNHAIRHITPAGAVTTLAGDGAPGVADGEGRAARFTSPGGLALDGSGNLYVADHGSHRVRLVTPAGVVRTLAGSTAGYADGIGEAALFTSPAGVAIDEKGNLYVSEFHHHRIRQITPRRVVTTLVDGGGNVGTRVPLLNPLGLALDAVGNLYVAEHGGRRVRRITPDGFISTLAGSGVEGVADGPGLQAQFVGPAGIAYREGVLYVADQAGHRVRQITWSAIEGG
jgi:DNA-binding beta-propeller fold protein YncE